MSVKSFMASIKILLSTFVGLAAMALSGPAAAGTFDAKIKAILLYDDGNLVYVYPEGGVVNPPACHGSNGNYLSFSMSRNMAKQYLSALMAAQLAGKTVTFTTTGTCRDQSVSETLNYFTVNNY